MPNDLSMDFEELTWHSSNYVKLNLLNKLKMLIAK